MVAKGLKVGDTFEDGGFLYEVTAIDNENYVSRKINKEDAPKKKSASKESKKGEE